MVELSNLSSYIQWSAPQLRPAQRCRSFSWQVKREDKMERILRIATLFALAGIFLSVSSVQAQKRPNIIICLVDDMGYADLGCYGSEISTPNIDTLASKGVKFTNFHAAATCSPTRSMLLTGVANHLVGFGNMDEIMADNQFDQPGYEGYLSNRVVTLPTILRDAGYHTYMAGKWHLGKKKPSLPASRGFERSIALMESGADNWEKKTYLPLYDDVTFYEGFEKVKKLPKEWFSTDYYIDRMIEYIGKDHGDGKPFFGYVSFQAQHYPHQAPQKYIDKYESLYNDGWAALRQRRYERQVKMGLMPAGLKMNSNPDVANWDELSDEEKQTYSKRMAVYAAMLDNLDSSIGRLRDYLRDIEELDNTVIVFMSDNGADNNDQVQIFPDWYAANFDLTTEQMGLKGSYSNYGAGWATASGAPLTLYKAAASEGGMRVPFFVYYPKKIQSGVTTSKFAYVTDIAPTLLELASVAKPNGTHGGREVHEIMGKSMVGLLSGDSDYVYGKDDYVAYELAGSAAVFRGNYKLMKNNPPFGDRQWRLYDINADPTEANDLSKQNPELANQMQADFDRYSEKVNLIPVPDDYNPLVQLQKNWERNEVKEAKKMVPVLD
jgi:arylsulfatase A-like enzyme